MITEQIILGIYIVLLAELAFILLIFILIILNIKRSLDSIHNLIQKFVGLGNITIETAEELKSKLKSLSGITSILGSIPDIIAVFRDWNDKFQTRDKEEEKDDLGEALAKVSPKKKRRII